MPAHTSQADVGVARLSDGTTLTKRDRDANDATGCSAKRDSEQHRVQKTPRRRIKNFEQLAEWALIFSGKEGTQRDSTELQAWKKAKGCLCRHRLRSSRENQ